jgi:PAS domain S-box-containing protein
MPPPPLTREQTLAVLCDLAFTIGGEASSEALLIKTLQRFLYHTGYSAGIMLTRETPLSDGQVGAVLDVVIGDFHLARRRHSRIAIPAELLPPQPALIESSEPLAALDTSVAMSGCLTLPVEGYGHMLLMSPHLPQHRANFLELFKPVLSRLGNAVILCREYERQHESTRRILLQAIEESPIGIIVTDTDGRIEYVNACQCAISGYSRHELIGHNPRILKSGDKTPEDYARLWQTITTGETWHGEFRNKRKDGTLYWEKAIISPVRDSDGRITHFVAVKEDVSDKKAREDELRRMVLYLTETNAELERFAFVASHDLREPLRTVTAFAQLLAKRYAGQLDADADTYINLLVGGAKRMDALISDLLVYSHIQTDGGKLSPVALDQACRTALGHLQHPILGAGAVVEIAPLPVVMGDEHQLAQLFEHLIDNAVKFRRPDVPPRITVSASPGAEGEWVVAVADNGIGVEASQQDIFEIFRRLHTADQFPGTGVGLAICKRIVRRLGGRIWHEANSGGGSIFRFTLRAAQPSGES